jgi:hypothetical protein
MAARDYQRDIGNRYVMLEMRGKDMPLKMIDPGKGQPAGKGYRFCGVDAYQ